MRLPQTGIALGMQGVFGALATLRDRVCPHCDDIIPASCPEHLFAIHVTDYNVDTIVRWLGNKNYIVVFHEVLSAT